MDIFWCYRLKLFTGSDAHIAFKYRSTDQEGAAAWEIDDVLLTGTKALSIQNYQAHSAFNIYLNPASRKFCISSEKPADVTIYTIQGKKVLEKTLDQEGYISVAGFNKGIYLVVVKNSKGSASKKLIIE